MKTYGILSAFREEIGERTTDWKVAYNRWYELYQNEIVYLVEWLTDSFFIVLRPK